MSTITIHLIIRFLEGDFIWFVLGGVSALAGWWLPYWIKYRWARVLIGLLLALLGVVLMHQAYETLHAWWISPINERMHLNIP